MFARRIFAIAISICVAFCTALNCYADTQAALVQAYVSGQNADVFVSGGFNVSNISCSVSNKAAEVTQAGSLADMGVTIRTTYLIDCSVSMPKKMRETVKEYLQSAIKNIGGNEQFKLVSFGDEITVLQDFTSDRYDLSVAADKLDFSAKHSKIYDSIYNTIPELKPLDDGKICFYRTVVITDGADATAAGITKEELYLKLQQLTYPIDVVAVSKTEQAEPVKDLAALTRISGGNYVCMDPSSDASQLYRSLDKSTLIWLNVTIPGELLDGSTRQFDISDGTTSLEFDYKVSVYAFEGSSQTSSEITESENPAAPDLKQSDKAKFDLSSFLGENTLFILIGIGAAIIMIAVVTVIICVTVSKKKAACNNSNGANPASGGRTSQQTSDPDRTEILPAGGEAASRLHISIKNVNDPNQNWSLDLSGRITVGRERTCELFVNESSISRRQCMLYVENNIPMIANLSQTNITSLNGRKLDAPAALDQDDVIKCGRVALKVIAIYDDSGSYSASGFGESGTKIQNV